MLIIIGLEIGKKNKRTWHIFIIFFIIVNISTSYLLFSGVYITQIIQYDRYKGADSILKPSQWLYHVQIWHAQRKQSELGSILSNFVVILNYLGPPDRGLNILRGEIFQGLWEKMWFHQVRETEEMSMEWDSEMTQKSLFLLSNLIFGIEINQIFHFHSLQLFLPKIDPKVVGFLLTTRTVIIKLNIVNFRFPKVS